MSDRYNAPPFNQHSTPELNLAWTEAQRRIEDLQQQVTALEGERATMREQIVADIRTTAQASQAANARLQAFNAEVTPDMTGEDIKRLAQKYSL